MSKYNKKNNPNSYKAQKARATARKTELLLLLGGKCELCGYSRNMMALCFHHVGTKEQKLDARRLANGNYEASKQEALKCQLLCHNCHMEVHHPHGNDWKG